MSKASSSVKLWDLPNKDTQVAFLSTDAYNIVAFIKLVQSQKDFSQE